MKTIILRTLIGENEKSDNNWRILIETLYNDEGWETRVIPVNNKDKEEMDCGEIDMAWYETEAEAITGHVIMIHKWSSAVRHY